jgi:hypothetical protein
LFGYFSIGVKPNKKKKKKDFLLKKGHLITQVWKSAIIGSAYNRILGTGAIKSCVICELL